MEEEYKEIDLKELLFVLLDKIWIILLTIVLFILGAVLITKLFMTPMYVSTTSVYVMNRQNNEGVATSADLSAASQLTKDYEAMVTSRHVLEQVIEKLGLNIDVGGLKKMVSVTNPVNTRLLEISVTSEDPYMAKNIADAIAAVSADRIVEIMGIEKVNVWDEGNIPNGPSSPSLSKNAAIAGILGLVLSCAVILIIFILDDRIKNSEDIEKYLGLSVLGMIPLDESMQASKKRKAVKTKQKPRNTVSDRK